MALCAPEFGMAKATMKDFKVAYIKMGSSWCSQEHVGVDSWPQAPHVGHVDSSSKTVLPGFLFELETPTLARSSLLRSRLLCHHSPASLLQLSEGPDLLFLP